MASVEELKQLQIPFHDIASATNDFAEENYIGLGGFGKVYIGRSEKHGTIAIKRLARDHGKHSQGDREFRTEIALLSIYKHENIVSLRGFCDEEGEMILVYQYESKGSLDKHLKSTDLTWTQRLKICLDAARGLKYLHHDVAPGHRAFHRDIKSANILLDENWKAKISDFGLSRKGPADVQASFVISHVCGTTGYVDPEYYYTGHLTQKSDVFSFGVVLFEVLSGRRAFDNINGQFFFVWVQKHYIRKTLDEIIHSNLHEQINPASLSTFSSIAYKCLSNGAGRPSMEEVVEQLQNALDNQKWSRATSSSSQSSPTTSQQHKYDVYVSFRGEDTRMTFVDHLYSGLAQQLEIFKDDESLMRGELIRPSLHKAMKESKIAIVVFSKNYANSRCCLDELAFIMKCRDERGLIVLPVFYHMEPSEVRKHNVFGAADINEVNSWRKALVDAANLAGFVVQSNDHQAKAIEQIVYTVTHRLLSLMPSDHEASSETRGRTDLIGIETRVQELRSLLEIESGGVRMVGICGIWGSGKSTLVSCVYDEIRQSFQGCSFVKNVCAESRMHGLKTLQEKILSDVFNSKVTLKSIEQGVSMMASRLCQKSVLIVLDDVNHVDHLKMLAGSLDWFGYGSRIIITTRNQDLVNAHNCITHNVRMFDVEEAIALFSRHAFGAGRHVEGYEELSRSIVSKLGGHPSAIKSLGSFLHEKDMNWWTSTLARLEGIPVHEILEKFNAGDDGVSRNIFSWFAT